MRYLFPLYCLNRNTIYNLKMNGIADIKLKNIPKNEDYSNDIFYPGFETLDRNSLINVLKENKRKELIDLKIRKLVSKNYRKSNLISILNRIPHFDIQFTPLQSQIIQRQNRLTLIIGRSGTGKTTIALLKMIAIDLLFIAKMTLELGKSKVFSEDIKRKQLLLTLISYWN